MGTVGAITPSVDERIPDEAAHKQDDVGMSEEATAQGTAPQRVQQRSQVVKPGEKRSKRGKRKAETIGEPPPLAADDYVRRLPASKRGEDKWKPVSLSSTDKAPQIELDQALTTATSRKGYRMVRATHGACEGTWYYEVTVSRLGESGHARLGWSTRRGELQAPVGYDEHSFAYRDLEGTKVHKGLREEYGEPYREGDVVGCFLHLGADGRPFEKERSDIVAWKAVGQKAKGEEPAQEEPRPLQGSAVAFTLNGKLQGIAYRNILEGTYYPAVSLYTLPSQQEGASIALNFGPEFRFPPPSLDGLPEAQPVSKMAGEPPKPDPPAEMHPVAPPAVIPGLEGTSTAPNSSIQPPGPGFLAP